MRRTSAPDSRLQPERRGDGTLRAAFDLHIYQCIRIDDGTAKSRRNNPTMLSFLDTRFTTLLLCALAIAPAARTQTDTTQPDSGNTGKRPVTHADVWLMRRISTPVLSPDGTQVVVSVTEPSYESGGAISDLWIVATDGNTAPRRLTSTSGSESGAVFRPDGKRLLFVAKRGDDEASQAYVLDMTAPGEAVRVTSHPDGVGNVQWSPDGTMLSFESRIAAPPGTILKEDEVNASAYDTFPVRYWDRWLDERQVHLFVQPVDGSTEPRDLLAGTQLVQRKGFSATPGRGQDQLQSRWSPDGKALLFVATTERHLSAHAPVRSHIYTVGLDGSEPERVTDDSDGSESGPRFSRDGRHLLYRRTPMTERVYNLTHVMQRDWPAGGKAQRLAADLDRPIGDFAETPDALLLLATEHGRRRIFAQNRAAATHPRLLDADSRGVYAGIQAATTPTGKLTVVARWEDSTHPAEIVAIDPATGTHRALTSFNLERAAKLDRQPFRELWFDSSRGRRIHCWLVLPPQFDENAKYPLLTWMHGGPHSSSLDADHVRWSPHLLAAPGYVVLMVDYTGSVGYGEQFAQAIQGDPLMTPGNELLQAARFAATELPFVDETRQAALGASYGGHLANWMQARTDHFRCLVGHAGLISLEGQWSTSDVIHHREINNGGPPWAGSPVWRDQSPSTYADSFQTPMLLTIGEKDYRVPLNQTLAAWSYLKRQQVKSRLLVFHQSNHWIMRGVDARYFWREVHAWLAEHLE